MTGTSTIERPAEAVIDPRIRARRIEVKRHEGRRRLSRLAEAALVLAVVVAFVGALWTPLLDVDQLAVRGVERLSADEVVEAARLERGTPLVAVDLAEVGARVGALPWVAEVVVHRGVDGVVSFDVVERRPVATVRDGDAVVLVDVEGRVLGLAAGSEGLPQLEGVGAVPAAGGFLPLSTEVALTIAAELAAEAPGVFSALSAEDLVATLAQGGQVRFGDADRLDGKLRSLATVLGQVDLTCLALIDLGLPGSPVLTREEGCP